MRKFLLVLLLSAGIAAPVAAEPPGFMHFERSQSDHALLDRLSETLNAIHSMKGSFVQLDPDGQIDEGEFYIQKPGRMRFEYQAPNPILIVSDGTTVAVQNKKLHTLDHYPIWSTPLDLVLSNDLNLNENKSIAGVSRQPGEIIVNARAASNKVHGNITLVFSDPGFELRQWTIVDAQGLSTTVSLRGVTQGVALDPALFTLPTDNSFMRKEE